MPECQCECNNSDGSINPATVRITITDLDGVVLDTATFCSSCITVKRLGEVGLYLSTEDRKRLEIN